MLSTRFIANLNRSRKLLIHSPKVFSNVRFKSKEMDIENNKSKLGEMSAKYKIFREEDSEEILDIYEERNKYAGLLEEHHEPDEPSIYEGLNIERGIAGVFDIEDLVQVLKRENAIDIFVASVPKELKYIDYICVVSGKSVKHMQAIAQFVRKVYKQKCNQKDIIPRLEGKNSKDWLAIDLGNIALHIFSKEARILYDLDSLWSIGPEYDKEYNKQDPVAEMLLNHSSYLRDLQPAS